ncbi:MAG: TetR/AcrR family transcriptional regulator [Eubacterium sp.]|nr:TetR/AcrR family transcriptional regulator [Eubacterium sp.]
MILEKATDEFGRCGKADAKISRIAGAAGVSVGVIYKYYTDKDTLFHICLENSLKTLSEVLTTSGASNDAEEMLRNILASIREFSKENPSVIRMYHAITSEPDEKEAAELAAEIEGISSSLYKDWISDGIEAGTIREDASPEMSAFFFDNLLMMLHFSYALPYYRQRYRIYCGKDVDSAASEKLLEEQLVAFLKAALNPAAQQGGKP